MRPARQPLAGRTKTTKIKRPHPHRVAVPTANPATSKPRARNRALTEDLNDATVLIDFREGSKVLKQYPPFDKCGELADVTDSRGRPAGDVMFLGNGPEGDNTVTVGVEMKTVSELLTSTDNGRFQGHDSQLPIMLDEYDDVWLLYYGKYRPAPGSHCLQIWRSGQWRNHYVGNRPVPYGYLEGFLIGLQAIGVNVKHVEDISQAAAWLAELVRWRTKPWHKHKSLKAFDKSRKVTSGAHRKQQAKSNRASLMPTLSETVLTRANLAVSLPTLGYKRAVAAARRWTIAEMVVGRLLTDKELAKAAARWSELTTTEERTGKVKRLGPVAGEAIAQTFNR